MLSHRLIFTWSSATRVLLLTLLLAVPLLGLSGYGATVDFNTRLSPNDACLGTYYFWWTNLTYLPLFFFALTILALSHCAATRYTFWSSICFIIYAFYPLELVDYLALNTDALVSVYSSYSLNTLLTNVLNRYHPFVFYLSVIMLAVVMLSTYQSNWQSHSNVDSLSLRVQPSLGWLAVWVNLLALWMGSWWALQEGTWGGWWNWDSSEVFGLLITLLLLWLLHSKLNIRRRVHTIVKNTLSLTLIIFSYFFIQLNFDLVSHNFGAKFFFFFNNNLFFIEVLLLNILTVGFTYYYYFGLTTNVYLAQPLATLRVGTTSYFIRSLVPLILVVWVIWSYRPLLNYFLWNFADINVFNFEPSLQPVNLLAVIVMFLWLTQIRASFVAICMATLPLFSNPLFALLIFFSINSRFTVIHASLAWIGLLNIVLYDLVLVSWASSSSYFYVVADTTTLLCGDALLVVDNTSVEQVRTWLSFTDISSFSWNILAVSNSPAVNFFTLDLSHSFFENYYYLSFIYTNACLWLELPLMGTLNLLFWAPLFLILNNLLRHNRNSNL